MNASLPTHPASEQDLHHFLAHALRPITARDSTATRPPRSTVGLKPTLEETRAFTQKLFQRLPPAFVTKFFELLKLTIRGQKEKNEGEKRRVERLAKIFAEAGEPGLWEEFVDLFMPRWRGELEIEEGERWVVEAMRGGV
ncbi:MAG: hypothetical protein Q9173_007300 [Seirophora scorigena]